ncbi:MAG: chorismate synthase, partial [Pirellulales bacterium]
MLRYWTAGESHGPALIALVDGFPAGLSVDTDAINEELRRRQGGHGRGGRQRIETDSVTVLSGLWRGVTLGSPIALEVLNRDAKLERLEDVDRPRPGHADLAGSLKHLGGVRAVLERASARETAARVAAGALARQLLARFGVEVAGWVRELGGMDIGSPEAVLKSCSPSELRSIRDSSAVYSLMPGHDNDVTAFIDKVGKEGDTLGGVVETQVFGLPIGLGTHSQWDRKLDGKIAQAVMAVQAIKGVEIGMGFEAARRRGSEVHDAIHYEAEKRQTSTLGFSRPTNNAGGLEAGMTNGQPLVVKAAMKPISTLRKPLASVNLRTKESEDAAYERSDVCAVSAC